MRFLVGLALALHLSGIPAVVAAPCSAGAAHECCMRHQTETGGEVIGQCGCPSADVARVVDDVSVAPASPHHVNPLIAVNVAVPLLAVPQVLHSSSVAIAVSPSDTGPPELTATGFRC